MGRFASADSIIPNPADPQSYNRYSYVRNQPLTRIDPTGHKDYTMPDSGGGLGGAASALWRVSVQVVDSGMVVKFTTIVEIAISMSQSQSDGWMTPGWMTSQGDSSNEQQTQNLGDLAGHVSGSPGDFDPNDDDNHPSGDGDDGGTCLNCGTHRPDLVRRSGALRVDEDGASVFCRVCVKNGDTPVPATEKNWIHSYDEFVQMADDLNVGRPGYNGQYGPPGHFSVFEGAGNSGSVFDKLNAWIRSLPKTAP